MTTKYSRRGFMMGSAATLAVLHANAFSGWAQSRPASSLTPGLQLFMVKDELAKDTPGTLQKLAAIGYRDVEYFAIQGYTASQFSKLLDQAGLRCPSAHLGFGIVETEKLLDDAAALGAHYVISSILPPPSLKSHDMAAIMDRMNHLSRDDFKSMAQEANEIAVKAQKRGMQYAYHNHNVEFRTFEDGETGYSIVMKETDPKLVQFEADLGWMTVGGANPLQIIKSAPSRFPLLHFKDFSVLVPPVTALGTDRQQKVVDLGQGLVPFKEIVAYAKAHLHIAYYIVDHDPPFHNQTALEAAKIDFDYLAGLLAS